MDVGDQMFRRRVALNSDSIQEDADAIAAGLETRQRTILQLRDYAKMADSLHMKSGQEAMTSSGVGMAGGPDDGGLGGGHHPHRRGSGANVGGGSSCGGHGHLCGGCWLVCVEHCG